MCLRVCLGAGPETELEPGTPAASLMKGVKLQG